MNLKVGLTISAYIIVCLLMCAFILANEDAEALGNPSPISTVRSTQKGSIIEYIIWSFGALFITSCIMVNRMLNSGSSNIIASLKSSSKIEAEKKKKSEPGVQEATKEKLEVQTNLQTITQPSQVVPKSDLNLANLLDEIL